MTKSGSQKRFRDILLLLLITVLVAGTTLFPSGGSGGSLFQGLNSNAVVVKAQKKSYSVKNGILGIDVSKYQGNINWSKVAKDDIGFAFVRASYGTTLDPYFVTNAQQAHSNGINVGAYHYATFKSRSDMQKEAKYFISLLKQVTITYPVVLDLEHTSHGLSKANLTTLANEFMELLEAEGYTPMLYTYQNYVGSYLNASNLSSRYNMWIANYLEYPSSTSHKVWQYSSTGRVSGISGHVDLNVAYEDLSTTNSGKLTVDRTISNSIKALLNERYGSSIPEEGFDYDQITYELNKAFQSEVNRQLGAGVAEDGVLTAPVAESLASIPYVLNETSGRITCLLQAKLFYRGHYTNSITGVYDDHTVAALRAFQRVSELSDTGELDYATWAALLGIA